MNLTLEAAIGFAFKDILQNFLAGMTIETRATKIRTLVYPQVQSTLSPP